MQRVLGRAVVVVLLCGLVALGVRAAGGGDDSGDGTLATPSPTAPPGGGAARVQGVAVALAADAELLGTIAPPFTIDVAARGEGGATIEAVTVDGGAVTIQWDSGRPLDIGGPPGGGLDPGPGHVVAEVGGVTVPLDGSVRSFVPGRYTTAAPVAVGGAGLATPRDGVTFDATAATALTTTGGARVRTPPRALRLEGPGRVSARGVFRVEQGGAATDATTVVFGPGPFTVDLEPAPGGYSLRAVLQGPLRTT